MAPETLVKPNVERDKMATVATIPGAEHTMREAKTGGPRELPYLNRFVPLYFATLRDWVQKNVMAQAATESRATP